MKPMEMWDVFSDIRYKPEYQLVMRPFTQQPMADLELWDRHYVQVTNGAWGGRKWPLSEHMTVSELVQTAFKAFLAFEEHECREAFTYKGQKVMGPHIDLEQLAEFLSCGFISISERT